MNKQNAAVHRAAMARRKAIREALKTVSQSVLAKRMGISRQRISILAKVDKKERKS